MVEMNGAFHAPPLPAPPGLALGLSRRASPRGACLPPLILRGGRIRQGLAKPETLAISGLLGYYFNTKKIGRPKLQLKY